MINLKSGLKTGQYLSEKLLGIINAPNKDCNELGATIALGLSFIGTQERSLVHTLLPTSRSSLDQIRSDYLLVRTIALNLIFWNDIYPSLEWIQDQIPTFIVHQLEKDNDNSSGLKQARDNIIAGL